MARGAFARSTEMDRARRRAFSSDSRNRHQEPRRHRCGRFRLRGGVVDLATTLSARIVDKIGTQLTRISAQAVPPPCVGGSRLVTM